jgi:hypothetical protein
MNASGGAGVPAMIAARVAHHLGRPPVALGRPEAYPTIERFRRGR